MTELPVIIAGAGPCGLVAALTLKRQGIRFVIIERAERSKLCANVGSGYDLAPTAIEILTNRLEVKKMNEVYANFIGLRVQTMEGSDIRELRIAEMAKKVHFLQAKGRDATKAKFGTINRSDLQNLLLEELFPTPQSESGVLRCGAGVQSYEKSKGIDGGETSASVIVTLSDGSTLEGRILLACDGIHSAVRKQMHYGRKDDLHFCSITCYWGKCAIPKDSKLEQDVLDSTKEGTYGILLAGSGKHPGSFVAMLCNNNLIWTLLFKTDAPPGAAQHTEDLTRRGGKILDETSKAKLLEKVTGRSDLLRTCLEATSASDITEAGIFDRNDNTLPYTDGECVVLLGDAAHPQSPFMGQGCNMAVVDAYVVATRLARHSSILEVLKAYDTPSRKSSVTKVIEQARFVGSISVSTSAITCWLMKIVLQYLPSSWLFADLMNGDQSNHDFMALLDQDFSDLAGATT
ncbi:salicylate 1-monooxygenase [Nitzschia inconspicua]|uniref:Salicylate 1-monooxygenase n=1 Tax=Nitzschia inconspicua TaxID=303405 RepID=A0A9K3PVZ2_9STRA|nr:salicylate 1-monooxygenase [Nitzschia inconspicua]